MTTNFNFTRFTNLLKLDIAENWKNSLFGLLGIYAAFLIPMLGWLWNPSAYSFHQFCNNMLGVVFLVTSFFLHILCFPHHDLHEQQGEAYLIPAASGHDV